MARLFELKNIIGVKDATGDLNRVDQQKKKMGPDFIQLSGEDGTALEFNLTWWSRMYFCYSKCSTKTLLRISRSLDKLKIIATY